MNQTKVVSNTKKWFKGDTEDMQINKLEFSANH